MTQDESASERGSRSDTKRYRSVTIRWFVYGLALLCLMPTTLAQSTDSELEALKEELRQLSERLQRQAAKIEELEARLEKSSRAQQETRTESPSESVAEQKPRAESSTRQPLGRFPDDAIVTAGSFDGAITIPGSDASIRLGGFVRAEGNYDFDNLGFQDTVSPRRIPLDGTVQDGSNQSRFHVRNSRFNIDYRKSTSKGPLRAFIELDFFGGGNELINGYEARIRHAAAQIGNLYIGQWWSYFADVQASPEGADFGGPMGSPAARNPGIRWAKDFGEGARWGVGLENPAGDLDGPEILLASDSVPNITGFLQLSRPWGRLRLAGLGLQLDSTTDEKLEDRILPLPLEAGVNGSRTELADVDAGVRVDHADDLEGVDMDVEGVAFLE